MTDPDIQKIFDRWAAQEMQTRGVLIYQQPTFTANSVPGYANRPVSTSLVRLWRRRRLIFGARYKGRDYFPAFQFSDGRPKAVIGRLLNILQLVPREDDWFLFYWFVAPNAWLDEDATPSSVMDSNEEAVIEAAERANDQISD